MNILLCSSSVPYPLNSGASLIVYNIVRRFSKNHKVYLICLTKNQEDLKNLKKLTKCKIFEAVYRLSFPKPVLIGKIIDILLSAPSYYTDLRYPKFSKNLISLIDEIVEKFNIDLIQPHGLLMSTFLIKYRKIPKVSALIDSGNLSSKRELFLSRGLSYLIKYLTYLRIRKLEAYVLEFFDSAVVVSEVDANHIKSFHNDIHLAVIPNGVDIDYFKPRENIKEENHCILFFGNMDFPPNIDAVLYIMEEIFPLVKAAIPNLKFYIVGENPVREIRNLNDGRNVFVTGFAPDVRAFIEKANVILTPMRKGTGIKNKILESMAMGKTIITNSMGAEALDTEAKKALIIRDSSQALAEAVIKVLKDDNPNRQLGKQARKVIEEKYTWERCAKKYEDLYTKILKQIKTY